MKYLKHLSWIVTIPVMVVAVAFAVANLSPAALEIWPFGVSIEAPLFLLVLGGAFVGFLLGGFVAWLSAGRTRRRAREAERQVAELRRDIARLHRELERAPSGAGGSSSSTALQAGTSGTASAGGS